MSICLLRAIHGKLLTKYFLKTIGLIHEEQCSLCSNATETIDHLFFQCPFSAYVWQLSMLELGLHSTLGTLYDEAQRLNLQFKQISSVFWQNLCF